MAKEKWNGDSILAKLEAERVRRLSAIGILVEQAAQKNVTERISRHAGGWFGHWLKQLRDSFSYRVDAEGVTVGTALHGAQRQEEGGELKPSVAKSLALPISDRARNANWSSGNRIPAMFPLAVYVKRNGKSPLLILPLSRSKGGKDYEVLYVLKQSVMLPARPTLGPAFENNKEEIKTILSAPIKL